MKMKSIFKFFSNKDKAFGKVAEQQLDKNMEVIKSLRDYDEGKKDISTRELERSLPNIRITSKA
jgi:hypothetical protein